MINEKVSIVILNYKVRSQAIECIQSVQKSSYKNIEIIVVDNNSEDSLQEGVKKMKGVHFIQSLSNLGYTGGNNLGIEYALGNNSQYIFILNPDTLIDELCIENLLAGAKKFNAQIVGPKIYFKNTNKIWFAGGLFDTKNVLGSHIGVDEEDVGQYDKEIETDYVTGGAMFVESLVFKEIGLFDDNYFLYYEDSDFCLRAKKKGYKMMYLPKAVVHHANAQSTGLGSPLQDYYITRNRMILAKKFLPVRTQFALIREALRNISKPVRRKAFIDFLLGRWGRANL